MVRWMCGVTLKDRKTNKELLGWLGIECMFDHFDVVRRGRLRWFGHIERKIKDDWVAACRDMVVEGEKGRGRKFFLAESFKVCRYISQYKVYSSY